MKLVGLGELTSFLDHVYLDALNVNANRTKVQWMNTEKCSNHESLSAGASDKLNGWEKSHAKTIACSYDMEGHAMKSVERYCDLANKTVEQLLKVFTPCLDDHLFKEEGSETWENCQTFALKSSRNACGEFCVYSEAEHSFPHVGCVRNELQYLTVPQNLKLFLQMQVCVWLPALDLWDLVIEVLHSSSNQPVQGKLCDNEQSRRTHQHQNEETLQPR